MFNTRRILATDFASSSVPQDPMTADPDVRVPATTRIPMNQMDVPNLANLKNTKNLATTTGQVDTTNLVGLNGKPLLPGEDPPLVPCTKGMSNMEQPQTPRLNLVHVVPANQRRTGGQALPSIGLASRECMPRVGLASHGQFPYPGLAGQSHMPSLGLADLEHTLFNGMASKALKNWAITQLRRANQPGSYRN
uniref:Uncharacterized protein n=1 Tax=Cannabis sativa TaxID=3483 RepID=A0A803PR02_CANSA